MKLTHSTSAVTGSYIPAIHVTAQTMAGQYHAVRSQENEDSIIKFENDSIMVVAVSDGCSSSAAAKAASQASCEASVKFAKTRDVWSTDNNTLKSAFLSVIDDVYMDTKLPYNLLEATLLLLVVSKITGDYVGISIGDCSALVLDENLNKPESLGHSISAAFVATLWGVLSANVLWLPLAARLDRLSGIEAEEMELVVDGVLAIQAGSNPRLVAQKLRSLLPPDEAKKAEAAANTKKAA